MTKETAHLLEVKDAEDKIGLIIDKDGNIFQYDREVTKRTLQNYGKANR